jgi:magnesium-transporting ATPase (P-type)
MNSPTAAHVGLSPSQAKERSGRDGPNELPKPARRTVASIALEVVREPMLAMLLAAGGIYLAVGDPCRHSTSSMTGSKFSLPD